MSYTPDAVTPEFARVADRKDFSHIHGLKFPTDRAKIKALTLEEKQVWYAAQDPHEHIEAGNDFGSFWYWHYILPLKLKRFAFLFKFW